MNRIEIQGILYAYEYILDKSKQTRFKENQNSEPQNKSLRFYAFQIFHYNINH